MIKSKYLEHQYCSGNVDPIDDSSLRAPILSIHAQILAAFSIDYSNIRKQILATFGEEFYAPHEYQGYALQGRRQYNLFLESSFWQDFKAWRKVLNPFKLSEYLHFICFYILEKLLASAVYITITLVQSIASLLDKITFGFLKAIIGSDFSDLSKYFFGEIVFEEGKKDRFSIKKLGIIPSTIVEIYRIGVVILVDFINGITSPINSLIFSIRKELEDNSSESIIFNDRPSKLPKIRLGLTVLASLFIVAAIIFSGGGIAAAAPAFLKPLIAITFPIVTFIGKILGLIGAKVFLGYIAASGGLILWLNVQTWEKPTPRTWTETLFNYPENYPQTTTERAKELVSQTVLINGFRQSCGFSPSLPGVASVTRPLKSVGSESSAEMGDVKGNAVSDDTVGEHQPTTAP